MNYGFSRPLYIMPKPAGARCNMACAYCYYSEKASMYSDVTTHDMSDVLLERFVREYIQSQSMPQVMFTWHGGEPLLRPLSFYRKAIALQKSYADGRLIDNSLQTNGTLLTDEWCRFLKENHWLVGISIDGPKELHDAYRTDRGGHPTFDRVMRGIELLEKHGVEWNAMATVNRINADHPLEFYRFFKSIGCHYLQFTPVVERICEANLNPNTSLIDPQDEGGVVASYSVLPQQWGNFLCVLFDEWASRDVGKYFVQIIEATIANWMGAQPGVCSLAATCGHAGVMEWNGDVYSCDHFVFPRYRLGNIRRQALMEMMYGSKQAEFSQMKEATLTEACRRCEFLFACHGECPKNRFVTTDNANLKTSPSSSPQRQNYLCQGYYQFFKHVAPWMENFNPNEAHTAFP